MNRDVQAIFSQANVPVFLSAFYATIDTQSWRLEYANAGHPPPLLARRAENEVAYLPPPGGSPGPPLGVRDQASYPVAQTQLGNGDVLLLFTDGLFEVVGADLEPFGEDQLREAVARRLHLPAGKMFDEVLGEVIRYSAGRGFADDVCLVGMEVRGG
jgi:sigma-B regulation protein RsbU (phosphoserine phosphatase)